MPLPGLSLLGFMDEQFALEYLRTQCIVSDPSEDALRRHWRAAQEKLGSAIPRAGQPRISDIPAKHYAYLAGVEKHLRFPHTVQTMNWAFKLVEIESLLAYQFNVHTVQKRTAARNLGYAPSREQVLRVCLPHDVEPCIASQPKADGDDIVITSPDLNVLPFPALPGENANERAKFLLFPFGIITPLAQVVRFEGRCYLKNGYHRAYQLWRQGVCEMPCLFLDATTYEQVLPGGGGVFSRTVLESANPPTCGHFVLHRAYPVTLRKFKRVFRFTLRVETEVDDAD